MVTLFLSFAVIVLVCSLVGHLCSRARPGSVKLGPEPATKHRSHIDWPDVVDGDSGRSVNLPDTRHHSGWGHSHSHSHSHGHSHDSGGGWGWGGDSGGGFGGDSGGGGGGD